MKTDLIKKIFIVITLLLIVINNISYAVNMSHDDLKESMEKLNKKNLVN